MKRCSWVKTELDAHYHDTEWGIETHDDTKLFEALILEGAQAGLSWSTILKKREGYGEVFYGFKIDQVAQMTEEEIQDAIHNSAIVRHEGKIRSTVKNAQVVLEIQEEFGSFDTYVWRFCPNEPRKKVYATIKEFPTQSTESVALSNDLKTRGCNFVGPTIMYAFMQAVGMLDEHEKQCWRA